MSQPSRKKAWLVWTLRLAGTFAVLGLLFYLLPMDELWRTMRRISPATWFAVLAGCIVAQGVAVIKWRMMVNLAGAGLDYMQATRCLFAGLFGNLFLPSMVGGDIVRAGLALRLGKSKAGVVLGSLLDRLLDMAALATVAAIGAMLIPGHLDPQLAKLFWLALGVLVGGTAGAVAVAWLVLRRRFSFRIRRKLVRLRTAGRKMARAPGRVLLAWVLGVVFQASLVALMARVAAECGLFIPFSGWLFAHPMGKLAALVPITQGGIGVREAALVVLLKPFGVPAVLTVAAGLVWQTIIISLALVSGLFVFLSGRASKKT
jgi:uncharacterized protein (TIRG00374 family)